MDHAMVATKDEEDGPERTCIVTRRKGDPAGMIRFVLGPDQAVVPDIRRKLPGRGVWVGARRAVVGEAVKRQAFSRGFKAKVAVSATLAEETEALLVRDCLQALSMANKAGVVVAGFAKVEAMIASGKTGAVVHATDAGADGIRKIDGALRRSLGEAASPASIKLFDSNQLDLALGRTNVIHAALAAGSASEAFLSRCRRLRLYRSEESPEGGTDALALAP
jgi:predicted RNA-binding protein YlxR (DUF448 family)